MLGASFIPARWRPADDNAEHRRPTWLSKWLSPYLSGISKRATVHPIYTIVTVAVLASTTYLGLLESSLFERHTAALGAGGNVDFDSLLVGSKTLYTNADNGWSWALAENGSDKQVDDVWENQLGMQGLKLITTPEHCADHLRLPQLDIHHPTNRTSSCVRPYAVQLHRKRATMFDWPSVCHVARHHACLLYAIRRGSQFLGCFARDPRLQSRVASTLLG